MQDYTTLYYTIDDYLQYYTRLNKTIQRYTRLYDTIQHYTSFRCFPSWLSELIVIYPVPVSRALISSLQSFSRFSS